MKRFILSSFSLAMLFVAVSGTLCLPSPSVAGRLDAAQKKANEFFKGKSFTAKLDLRTTGKYDVDPDGNPTTGKSQGRRRGSKGIGQREIVFSAGDSGRGIYVRVDESDREVKVVLAPKRGVTMHSTSLYIHFDRPLTEADVDPRSIARALTSLVEFEGVVVGAELSDALDRLDGDTGEKTDEGTKGPTEADSTSSNGQPAAPTQATVTQLDVFTSPEQALIGGEVALKLAFELSWPAGITFDVTQQRHLTRNGESLPGYPVKKVGPLTGGRHQTSYSQPIPDSAEPGTYEFRGEVCVGGDCIVRTISFELTNTNGLKE